MKPEEFSSIRLYGNKQTFLKMQAEGFTDVAFAKGPWINDKRIVGAFYFFGPEDQVAGYETSKSRGATGATRRSASETHYQMREFEQKVRGSKLELSDIQNLAALLLRWD